MRRGVHSLSSFLVASLVHQLIDLTVASPTVAIVAEELLRFLSFPSPARARGRCRLIHFVPQKQIRREPGELCVSLSRNRVGRAYRFIPHNPCSECLKTHREIFQERRNSELVGNTLKTMLLSSTAILH